MHSTSSVIPGSVRANSAKTRPVKGSSATTGSVTKRLSNELMQLMMSATPGISAFPSAEGDLFDWTATIDGPSDTYYAGKSFKLRISFPSNYPYSAPSVTFTTTCYHPNVALQGGYICLDILKEKWSAIYNVQSILVSIQSLLGEPNNASPLNVDAAQIWEDREAFTKELEKHYNFRS